MDEGPRVAEYSVEQRKRLKDLSADLPGMLEYAHSVGGFAIVPTKEGDIKNKAIMAMNQQTQMQLDMLFEQAKLIAKQVNTIQERAKISELVYHAKFKFEPVVGGRYFIYKDGEDTKLSLIGPKEWREDRSEDSFISEIELLADHTWKVIRKNPNYTFS